MFVNHFKFQSVVITSGTLSPIEMYPRLLDFQPVVMVSLSLSMARGAICPMVVARGNDQVTIRNGDKKIKQSNAI